MLLLSGIVSKSNRGIQQLDHGFYDMGFPHPGVKATVKQANKLLMHYKCHMALGTELQTSLNLLMVNLGLSFQPFGVSFENYSKWVMTSWVKGVWEKVDHYNLVLLVHNLLSVFLQEGDDWLMARFIATGYNGIKLLILNRVGKHQQVLFLSDILGAGGGLVDKKYLRI